jgi:hypothetical protein
MIRKLTYYVYLLIYYAHDITALIIALLALFIAIKEGYRINIIAIKYISISTFNGILPIINRLFKIRRPPMTTINVKEEITKILEIMSFPRKTIFFLCLLLSIVLLVTIGFTKPKFKNELLTEAAWIAYNDKKYEDAIIKADECIREFEGDALEEQEELQKNKIPPPPEGRASINISQAEREAIFKRGVLNDVGTCWYIKASSLEKLTPPRIAEAKKAYEKTTKFPYARTWDPGWKGFWSPAKKATGILKHLEGK